MSIAVDWKVFTRLRESAPAFTQAIATARRSGAFGERFTIRGFFVTARTADTHSNAASGFIPHA